MSTVSNPQISYLLDEGVKKSGADFTKVLCEIGNGNMGTGVCEVWIDGWNSGQTNGIGIGIGIGAGVTICILSVAIGAYTVIKNAVEVRQTKKAVEELNEECRKQQSEFISVKDTAGAT